MLTNDSVASALRKELGIGTSSDSIIALTVSLVPHAIIAIFVFAFMLDSGAPVALLAGLGAFAVTTGLGYVCGKACGDTVGIADDYTDAAMKAQDSFFRRDRADDYVAMGMGVVVVQFLCGSLYKSIEAMRGGRTGEGLGVKREMVAVAAIRAALENNGVSPQQLTEAIQTADGSISAQEVDSVVNFLKDRGLMAMSGPVLIVPVEKVSSFYS